MLNFLLSSVSNLSSKILLGIILSLAAALTVSGYAAASYMKTNAVLENDVERLTNITEEQRLEFERLTKINNDLNESIKNRELQFQSLQESMDKLTEELGDVQDETGCLDTKHPLAAGLLLNKNRN